MTATRRMDERDILSMSFRPARNEIERNSKKRIIYIDGKRSVVEGLQAGDPAALETFYEQYSAYIRKILARIMGAHHSDLDDCLQETFTTAYYKAAQIKNPDLLKTWLTRIAINRALDHLRKKKRESWLQFWAPENIPEIALAPPPLEDKEAVHAVYQILEALPPKTRIPFVLRRMEKLPLAEIACITKVSLATTKRRIAAAQKRFESLAQNCTPLEAWLNKNGRWRHI